MSWRDPRLSDGWEPVYAPEIVEHALPGSVCERAVAIAEEVGFEASPVYNERGVGEIDSPDHRVSESAWLRPEHYDELFRLAMEIVRRVNSDRYRFAIQAMTPIQIIRYRAGGHFDEHFDIGVADAAKRKISLVVQLSGPSEYEGGDFVLGRDVTMPKTRGTACIFPSWFSHRVEPVTSGMRYSLTAWSLGPYFS